MVSRRSLFSPPRWSIRNWPQTLRPYLEHLDIQNYIYYLYHYFNKIRVKNPAVYKKDRLSINSADVQKIRNTTCQKEAESRGSKETINTKKIKISKLLDFQIFYLQICILERLYTVTDIQPNCFVQSAVLFIHILYAFKILLL